VAAPEHTDRELNKEEDAFLLCFTNKSTSMLLSIAHPLTADTLWKSNDGHACATRNNITLIPCYSNKPNFKVTDSRHDCFVIFIVCRKRNVVIG